MKVGEESGLDLVGHRHDKVQKCMGVGMRPSVMVWKLSFDNKNLKRAFPNRIIVCFLPSRRIYVSNSIKSRVVCNQCGGTMS